MIQVFNDKMLAKENAKNMFGYITTSSGPTSTAFKIKP